jgi:hypothetical protein
MRLREKSHIRNPSFKIGRFDGEISPNILRNHENCRTVRLTGQLQQFRTVSLIFPAAGAL